MSGNWAKPGAAAFVFTMGAMCQIVTTRTPTRIIRKDYDQVDGSNRMHVVETESTHSSGFGLGLMWGSIVAAAILGAL